MFRNWLSGSRDLYVSVSDDQAVHFNEPVKLGRGTWKLKGCPMDGGAIIIDDGGEAMTTWRREGEVYLSKVNQVEQKIGEGKQSHIANSGMGYAVVWSHDKKIYISTSGQPQPRVIGEGTYPRIVPIKKSGYLIGWEREGKILSLLLPANTQAL